MNAQCHTNTLRSRLCSLDHPILLASLLAYVFSRRMRLLQRYCYATTMLPLPKLLLSLFCCYYYSLPSRRNSRPASSNIIRISSFSRSSRFTFIVHLFPCPRDYLWRYLMWFFIHDSVLYFVYFIVHLLLFLTGFASCEGKNKIYKVQSNRTLLWLNYFPFLSPFRHTAKYVIHISMILVVLL